MGRVAPTTLELAFSNKECGCAAAGPFDLDESVGRRCARVSNENVESRIVAWLGLDQGCRVAATSLAFGHAKRTLFDRSQLLGLGVVWGNPFGRESGLSLRPALFQLCCGKDAFKIALGYGSDAGLEVAGSATSGLKVVSARTLEWYGTDEPHVVEDRAEVPSGMAGIGSGRTDDTGAEIHLGRP
jgi:hypothetical protein